MVFGSKQKLPQPTLHFLKNYENLLHNCLIFISNMPHNGFIYEARMNMMENSGHWFKINAVKSRSTYSIFHFNCTHPLTKRLIIFKLLNCIGSKYDVSNK